MCNEQDAAESHLLVERRKHRFPEYRRCFSIDKQCIIVINRKGITGYPISVKMHLTRFADDRDVVLLKLRSPPCKGAVERFEVGQLAQGAMIHYDGEGATNYLRAKL